MTDIGERGLKDADLPGLFQAADAASLEGQRRYVRAVRLRLVLALVAAAAGVATWRVGNGKIDVLAIVTVLSLAAIVFVEGYLGSVKPASSWYDGRALAESAKSLGWRYAVGAAPYPAGDDELRLRGEFVRQVDQLLIDAPTDEIHPTQSPVISDAMAALRAAPIDVRRRVYLRDRIDDQRTWYAGKATTNRRLVHRWSVALLVIELAGISAAIAKAVNLINFDLAGVVATLIAAGTAWLALRQHAFNARAYAFAANELGIVQERLLTANEAEWPAEAADAEEAVSREHTMWRASRSRPLL